MKHAKVTLWGKYKYNISFEDDSTMHDITMAIALEVHKQEGKTKFTEKPRTYNYIYECLLRKSCLNFRVNADSSIDNTQELLKCANEPNSKSEFVKKECSFCHGSGFENNLGNQICHICNGHEYIYEHQDYRLGYTQNNTLIIDLDGKDEQNLRNVKAYYEQVLLCIFKVFGTRNGYWLFSDKKYEYLPDWLYDHCRVLCPTLERRFFELYQKNLLSLDEYQGEFQRATPEKIKASELYKVPYNLNFDIAFTFLSIKRQRSTIRITKKGKYDQIEQITI